MKEDKMKKKKRIERKSVKINGVIDGKRDR